MVVSVGVDVGKSTCVVALRYEDATYSQSSFPNTSAGVQKCIAFLQTKGVSEKTPLIFESTGGYHLLFAMTLKDTHFRGVKVINGILTKKYQKAKIRKVKTDAVDARMLADMGLFEQFTDFTQTKKQLAQKKQISLLRQLEKIHQQLKASLNSAEETATNLHLKIPITGMQNILKVMKTEMEKFEKQIVAGEKDPLVQELAQIPGVSALAAAIMVSILGGKSFDSKGKLVAFTGLDLSVRESGTSIHAPRSLTKRGDPFFRKKVFQTAWALKMHHPKYKEYYEKKRAEGKHYYTCLIAVARKFLHHFFALQRKLLNNQLALSQSQPLA